MSECKAEELYKDGLNFECNGCSRCCRFDGGVVFLSQDDLERISKWANLTAEQFIKVYCRYLEDDSGKTFLTLKTLSGGDCIFWDASIPGCQAYQARPTQCSTYPFWTKIMESKESWLKEKDVCPGINEGPLHSFEEIREQLELYQSREKLVKTDE